jgi:hypothetical protein
VLPAAALLLPLLRLRPSDFLSLPSRASLITVRVGIRRGNADPACRVRSSKTMAVDDDDASTAPSMVQLILPPRSFVLFVVGFDDDDDDDDDDDAAALSMDATEHVGDNDQVKGGWR